MKNLLTRNGTWKGWLLTPYPDDDYGFYSYFVSRYGGIVVSVVKNGSGAFEQILHLSSPINVYPTLYLNSDTMANVSVGNGTSSNSYQIVID